MGLDSFAEIERRIKRIEAALGISDEGAVPTRPTTSAAPINVIASATAVPAPSPIPRRSDRIDVPVQRRTPSGTPPDSARPAADSGTGGMFLGAIAGFCLILAAVLMIRLAIESGWLTPLRQVFITALFGAVCIATGFFSANRDRRYLAILPGLGVAILNLAVYGAAFVHYLIEPAAAAVAISGIAIACLGLYAVLSEDLYIIYAVLGTHLGAVLLGGSAPTPEVPLAVLAIWNVVFAGLAVRARSRRLLSVVAYCGFAAVYFVGHGEDVRAAAFTQAALFFVFLAATVRFSKEHQAPLTEAEAGSLLPPLVVFYITEYAWLTKLIGPATPYLFLGIAGVVWLAYASAAAKIRAPLASGRVVYLFVAGTVLHAFFFQIVPDSAKPLVGLVLSGAVLARSDRLDFRGDHLGLKLFAIVTGLGGFLMALFDVGPTAGDLRFAIVNGVAYGSALLFLGVSARTRKIDPRLRDFAVVLAHLQWMTALYRARELVPVESLSLVVTVLWVAYAFAVFALGWAGRLAWVCRSCLFILGFCVLKLMIYDVWNQPATIRIVSLAGLGLALYAFGFLLRRVSAWAKA